MMSYDWMKQDFGGKIPSTDPLDWGIPGELTDDELKAFMGFRKEVERRGDEFQDTVFSFGEEEGEAHALCRWLRARKFDLWKTVAMTEEATVERGKHVTEDFYPDPEAALGVKPQIYVSQYPQLYQGHAKSGSILFISKPGVLNVNAVTCMTTMDGILKYHWYAMIHDYGNRLRERKGRDPEGFTRYQMMCVMDLANLGMTQITKRCLSIIKEQSRIDSLCFPETLDRFVVVNCPRFFSATWSLIQGWLDPRTVAKIELINSKADSEKRLRELVDDDQLPKDYGGTAEDTTVTLMKESPEGCIRQHTDLMTFRSSSSLAIRLDEGEKAEIYVYTRSCSGALFSVLDEEKKVLVSEIHVVHTGGDDLDTDPPTCCDVTQDLKGPGTFTIKAILNARQMRSENFFVVSNVF